MDWNTEIVFFLSHH